MSPTQISNFLDGAIRNRTSVRLIAEQHIALSQAWESQRDVGLTSHYGIVDMACSPAAMVKMCGAFVNELCEATLGAAPTIVIDGHQDATFACVPILPHLLHPWSNVLSKLCSCPSRIHPH